MAAKKRGISISKYQKLMDSLAEQKAMLIEEFCNEIENYKNDTSLKEKLDSIIQAEIDALENFTDSSSEIIDTIRKHYEGLPS